MRRTLRTVATLCWHLLLILFWQPTSGPSRADRQNVQAKHSALQHQADRPVTFGQLVRSALVTAMQVLANQPAPRPARGSDRTPGHRRR